MGGQIIATDCAAADMRIHLLPLGVSERVVDVPGEQRRDLLVLCGILETAVMGHPILAGNSDGPPPKIGKYWRNFSRA